MGIIRDQVWRQVWKVPWSKFLPAQGTYNYSKSHLLSAGVFYYLLILAACLLWSLSLLSYLAVDGSLSADYLTSPSVSMAVIATSATLPIMLSHVKWPIQHVLSCRSIGFQFSTRSWWSSSWWAWSVWYCWGHCVRTTLAIARMMSLMIWCV